MCQVRTGAHVSLLAPGKTGYIRLPPKKDYHVQTILHVVPFTTHTHDRRKSIGKKNKEKKKMKERKETTKMRKNEEGKERREKTKKARKDKTRRGSKERKRSVQNTWYKTLGIGVEKCLQ